MHVLNLITSFYLVVSPLFVYAQVSQNETYIAQGVAKIPACGLECLSWTVPEVGCSILDVTCQCSSQSLITITAQCMMSNCTLEEAVELDKVQADICGRSYQSRNQMMRIMTIVCITITYTAIFVRLIARYCLSQSIGLDDWFIIAAASTNFIYAYFGVQFEHNGFGEHVWKIQIDMISKLLYWFYICEVFYVSTTNLVKFSILAFYLKVFPARPFRLHCWAIMCLILASTIAFLFTTIFQCNPVSFVWNKNIPGGRCINFNAVTWTNAAFNIVQDLLIIALPIPEVKKLQLKRKKKIQLYLMFGLGGFVCIASMVRLSTLKSFGLTADPTWDNVPVTFWTTMETTTAVLCACLPSIRAGLLQFLPAVSSSITSLLRTRDGSILRTDLWTDQSIRLGERSHIGSKGGDKTIRTLAQRRERNTSSIQFSTEY